MLHSISDQELLLRLERLCRLERETTLEVLQHLNEIERRRLHLNLGYPSLFAYCTQHLKYSESGAGRRVQAARCLRQYSRVASLLKSGEINLMTLGSVAGILTPENVDDLLGRIRGKTQREVEALAGNFRPAVRLRDRVQHVNVPALIAPAARVLTGPVFNPPPVAPAAPAISNSNHSQTGSEKSPNMTKTVPKVYVQFLADKGFMKKYNEACALLSNRLGHISFEAVLGAVLDEFIARHSPEKREERRAARGSKPAARPSRTSRAAGRPHISRKTRDTVFIRDRGQCAFVGSTGQRCEETRHLHVDHVTPLARNGTSDLANLRLLCARHNQLEAVRVLGEAVVGSQRRKAGSHITGSRARAADTLTACVIPKKKKLPGSAPPVLGREDVLPEAVYEND